MHTPKTNYLSTILFCSLLTITHIMCQQAQIANFPQILNSIKSGDHKLVNVRLTPNRFTNLTQPLNRTFTSNPIVAIGILIFQVQAASRMGFTVQVGNITRSSFDSLVTALSETNINQLHYTYVAIQSDGRFGFLPLVSMVANTGGVLVDNSVYTEQYNLMTTLNLQNQHIIKTFLKDFNLIKTSTNQYSIRVDAQILSDTKFLLTLKSNCTVTATSFYIFWIDRTTLQANHTFYLDPGFGYNEYNVGGVLEFDVKPSEFNYFNFLRGANWLAFNTSGQVLFSVSFNSFPFPTYTKYKYAMGNLVHWRKRQCRNINYSFYLQEQLKCYDTCPAGYANNVPMKFCQKCDYTCNRCQSDGATCIDCPTGSFRTFNGIGGCPCDRGYFSDVGNRNPVCLACDYTCATCQVNKSKCLSCDSTRTLSANNECVCNSRLFDPQTNTPVCLPCHYTCLKCISSQTTCLDCNPTSNRILVLSSCLCKSGYSQQPAPNEQCIINNTLICQSPCLTCQTTATRCTGCNIAQNRELNNFRCVCKLGYAVLTSGEVVCREICGDGLKIQVECDDGNVNDGDGCSSGCRIQGDFVCDVTVQPTQCVYKYQYTIKLVSISKNPTQNTADLIFQITPPPPQNSIGTIQKIPNRILSQSLSTSQLTLTIEYTQTIPIGSFAQLSLSTIPNKLNFQLASDNGLTFTYYDSSNYVLYNVENVLIWVLIGLSWVLTLVAVVGYKIGVLYVLEYMVNVGVIWVGIQVSSKYELYFQPLVNLKYIFGYNASVALQDGLFAYTNYGLILLLLPALSLLIIHTLYKITKNPIFQLPPQTKKYILIELTSLFILFYAVIIMYSLCTQSFIFSNSVNTALSITSIIFGVLYLGGVAVLCGRFLRVKEFMCFVKSQIVQRKGLVYFVMVYTTKIIYVMIYTLVSYIYPDTIYFPFIPICFSVLTLLLTLKLHPYQNNIRVLINQLILITVFLCYFLIREVRNAQWSGFGAVMILYVGLGYTGWCVLKGVYGRWRYQVEAGKRYEEGDQRDTVRRIEREQINNKYQISRSVNQNNSINNDNDNNHQHHHSQGNARYEQNYYTHENNQNIIQDDDNRIDMDFDPRNYSSNNSNNNNSNDNKKKVNNQQKQRQKGADSFSKKMEMNRNDDGRFVTVKKQGDVVDDAGLASYRKKMLSSIQV